MVNLPFLVAIVRLAPGEEVSDIEENLGLPGVEQMSFSRRLAGTLAPPRSTQDGSRGCSPHRNVDENPISQMPRKEADEDLVLACLLTGDPVVLSSARLIGNHDWAPCRSPN